jgi:hypothetical protein
MKYSIIERIDKLDFAGPPAGWFTSMIQRQLGLFIGNSAEVLISEGNQFNPEIHGMAQLYVYTPDQWKEMMQLANILARTDYMQPNIVAQRLIRLLDQQQ